MAKLRTNVRVVANAIRKNGYKQAFGTFHDANTGARCAVGQGAANLRVDPSSLFRALNKFKSVDGHGLGDSVVAMNDEAHWPLSQIADRIERDWANVLDERVEV